MSAPCLRIRRTQNYPPPPRFRFDKKVSLLTECSPHRRFCLCFARLPQDPLHSRDPNKRCLSLIPHGLERRGRCRLGRLYRARKNLPWRSRSAWTSVGMSTFAFQENMRWPQTPLHKKNMRGIYRREYWYIPAVGPDSVNRRIKHCDTLDGSNSMHQFEDIG